MTSDLEPGVVRGAARAGDIWRQRLLTRRHQPPHPVRHLRELHTRECGAVSSRPGPRQSACFAHFVTFLSLLSCQLVDLHTWASVILTVHVIALCLWYVLNEAAALLL